MILIAAAQLHPDVLPARAQMATTLGFHIILACFGIALPTFVLLAEYVGLRRNNESAMRLARRWSSTSLPEDR
jgi:cytochrome d ubiquinol oxidase subunit I